MSEILQKIKTTRFGEIEIDETLVFDFVSPIIGYNDEKKFALIDWRPDSPFKWLQSLKTPELAFPVTLCSYFQIDYQFELSDQDAQTLGIENAEDVLALNIVTIPQINPKGATINLLAPIIINTQTNAAAQIILKDSNLPVRKPLFENQEKASEDFQKAKEERKKDEGLK